MIYQRVRFSNRSIVVLLTIFLFGAFSQDASGQDLFSNWTFDDDSGEDFVGDFPLQYVGGFEIVPGLLGNGIRFTEGGGALQDGIADRPTDDAALDLVAGDFTMQAWVNWNTTAGEQIIMEKFGPGGGGPGWTLTKIDDDSVLFFFDADVIDVDLRSGPGAVFAAEWNHIAVRNSGGDFELFVNGISAALSQPVGALSNSDNPLRIGKRNDGDARGFAIDGVVDDVAFWDRDLSNGDLESLYGDGFGSEVAGNFELGLIAYFPMEGNGDDASGVTGPLDFFGDTGFVAGQFGDGLSLTPAPAPSEKGYAVTEGDGGFDSPFNFGDEDFTISVWVNYDDDSGEQVLIEKFDGAGGPGWTLTKLASQVYHFYSGTAVNSPGQTDLVGAWTHIVVERETNFTRTYRDGQLMAEGDGPFITEATNELYIGRRNPGDGRGFFGKAIYDDFAIWDGALGEDQILDLYNDGFGATACCLEPPEPRCGPPQNVALDNVGENELRITWSAPAPVAGIAIQGYEVFQTSPPTGGDGKLHEGLLAGTELMVTGLQIATRHCFQVRCVGDNDLAGRNSDPACSTTAGTLELPEGLLGYWPFDDLGSDCSGQDRHLETSPNVLFDDGILGDALVVPAGEAFAVAPAYRPVNDPELDFGAGDFTIQVWANFAETAGEQVLIEKFLGGGGPAWTLTKLAGDTILFYSGVAVSGPAILTPGQWHHVLVRSSGDIAEIFLDGEVLATGNSSTIASTEGPLIFGQRNTQDGRGFIVNGSLDEVAIWNRAVTDQDIAALYNDGFGDQIFTDCGVAVRPNPPSNVQTAAGPNDITVSWTAAAAMAGVNISGYNVYRTSGAQSRLNTDPINGTQFNVADLPGGSEVCFTVRTAGDNGLESNAANESCATPTAEPPQVDEGLLGYWPFDDDGSDCTANSLDAELAADDLSVEIGDGLIGGGALSIIPGLLLDPNEAGPAYRTADDQSLDFGASDFTIQVWIFYNFDGGEQVLLEKFLNGGGPGWTLTKLDGNALLFYASGFGDIQAPSGFLPEQWHQAVVRKSGSTAELIVDTVTIVAKDFGGAVLDDTDGPLIFGMRNKADGRGFLTDGLIDDVAIWNRALSDADIQSLFNDGFGRAVNETCDVPLPRPNAPVNVSAQPGADREVDISWSAGAAVAGVNVVGYNVFQTAPVRRRVNTDPVNATNFTATGLFGGTEVCYAVQAIGDNGKDSGDSAEDCATPTGPGPNVGDGVLGFWDFDGDGSDCSPNGRDLTTAVDTSFEDGLLGDALYIPLGGPIFEEGELGPAFRFEDDQELDFGANDFSVQCWVNFVDTAGEQVLVEKFGPGGGGPGWTLTKLANDNLLFFAEGVGAVQAPSGLLAGEWSHLVARRFGDTTTLFVNGQAIVTGDTIGTITDSDNGLLIGMRNLGDGRGFLVNGSIDQVGIWNRALNDAEIGVLYNDGFGSNAACGDCVPVAEDCNDGIDNDCDGLVDGNDPNCDTDDDVGPFLRGDCDGNGNFGGTPTEAIVLLNFSFRGGPAPPCLAACDAEANGAIGITDALRILRAAFLGTGQPDAPFPNCEASALESDIDLGCETPFCSP